jgi:hypothetical protein
MPAAKVYILIDFLLPPFDGCLAGHPGLCCPVNELGFDLEKYREAFLRISYYCCASK